MSQKSCCIKVKNCGGVIKGNLKGVSTLANPFSNEREQKRILALETFKGVEAATLFALENPEASNPFTPEKEIQLVELIDSLVALSADYKFGTFNQKVHELMEFSGTI